MKWDGEKLATRGLIVLAAYAAVRSVFCAASRPFWFDELCTVGVARQPSLSAIWSALQHAADSHPPTYYFLQRFVDHLFSNPHVAFRLTSIAGFCCIVACVFVFVRKHSNAEIALLCSALTLMSVLYDTYAVEARGYALMSGCIAIAVVCYQRVNKVGWAILMASSLITAGLFQYYAVFALFPFALAEAAFVLRSRRLRPGVWIALAFGMLPTIIFWPLLSQLKQTFGAHFWAKPSWRVALTAFGWFLNVSPAWGVAVTAAAAVAVIAVIISEFVGKDATSLKLPDLLHERVLVIGFLVLPLAILVAMKITHGGLVARYMLPGALGVPLAAGCILARFDRRSLVLFGVFLGVGVAAQEASFWIHQRHRMWKIISPATEVEQLVNATGQRDLPVVVSGALDYFQLVFYGSPAFAARLAEIVDPSQELIYSETDNVDKALLILRDYLPLHVYEFNKFVSEHSAFLLCSTGTAWDWWPDRLVNDGYALRLIAVQGNSKIYLVSRHETSRVSAGEENERTGL